jgi:hypothetical protein
VVTLMEGIELTRELNSAVRSKPSPSFNAESKYRNNVQPLVNPRPSDVDESCVQ